MDAERLARALFAARPLLWLLFVVGTVLVVSKVLLPALDRRLANGGTSGAAT